MKKSYLIAILTLSLTIFIQTSDNPPVSSKVEKIEMVGSITYQQGDKSVKLIVLPDGSFRYKAVNITSFEPLFADDPSAKEFFTSLEKIYNEQNSKKTETDTKEKPEEPKPEESKKD